MQRESVIAEHLQLTNHASRYGGTVAPCDRPIEEQEAMGDTGFLVPTRIGRSTIPEAGTARFFKTDVANKTVVRRQPLNSKCLKTFYSREELKKQFPADADVDMIATFVYSAKQVPGAVLINDPPTYVNHGEGADVNVEYQFEDGVKLFVAIRDIKAGEEWMMDYTRELNYMPQWFDDLQAERGRKNVRKLADDIVNGSPLDEAHKKA